MSRWPRLALKEAIDRTVGGKNVEAGNGSSPYRILKVSAVTSGHFRPDEAKPAPDNYRPPPEHHIRKGDFLFSRANTSALVGAVAIVEDDHSGLLLPDKIWRIEWRRDVIEPRFAYFMLRSSGVRRVFAQVASGTSDSMKNISQKKLLGIEAPIPPLEEQRRIVGFLDRAAEIRRRANAARAKARAIIPALFLDMFGDPATNAKGWRQVRFSEVVSEFRYGTNQKCHDPQSDGDVAVLRIPNVIGGRIDWSDLKFSALSTKERGKTNLCTGDILFVRTNGNPEYIGRCAMFEGTRSASYASYLIRARLTADLLPFFAVVHFNHQRYRSFVVRAGRTTAGNFNLSTEGLGALHVVVPPIPLQTTFAEQAHRLEATTRALDTAAAKAEAMAAALSAEVFGASPGRWLANGP